MVHLLSNQVLIYSYHKAAALNLEQHFIFLLEEEIRKRNLTIQQIEQLNY
jgi:hypothetical protein